MKFMFYRDLFNLLYPCRKPKCMLNNYCLRILVYFLFQSIYIQVIIIVDIRIYRFCAAPKDRIWNRDASECLDYNLAPPANPQGFQNQVQGTPATVDGEGFKTVTEVIV